MFQILLLKCKHKISFWKAWFPVIAFSHVWGNARPVHKGTILHWPEMPRTNPLGGKMPLTSASHQHRVRKDSTVGAHFLHGFPPCWALSPHVRDPWPSGLLSQPVILNHIFFFGSQPHEIHINEWESHGHAHILKAANCGWGQGFSIVLYCSSTWSHLYLFCPLLSVPCWKSSLKDALQTGIPQAE